MKLWNKIGVGIVALTAALTGLPSQGYAMNGSRQIGYGVKSKGMGGVAIALPQDTLVAASNPAGMAFVADRWDVGLGYVFQNGYTEFSGIETTTRYKTDEGIWLPEAGVAYMYSPCQVVGVSIWTDEGMQTKYGEPIPGLADLTNPQPAKFSYYNWIVAPSWSWRINTVHTIGVALNVNIANVDVDGAGQIAAASRYPLDVTNRGGETTQGVSVRFGWLGNICDDLTIGFTFQTKTWMRKFKQYQGLFPDAGSFDRPGHLGVGITWFPWQCVTLSAEYDQVFWTGVSDSFWDSDANFGSNEGPGFGWNQQGIVKIGLAYQVLPCLTLRVGYNWGRTPIKNVNTFINIGNLAVVEHHVTVGATYAFSCNEVSAYYYHGFNHTLTGEAVDFLIPNPYNLNNKQNAVGVSYGRRF